MLLALSASPEELEVRLISVTYGNIDLQNCLRNVISLFHHIREEIMWRNSNGHDAGFETIRRTKPVVAIGAAHPLLENEPQSGLSRKSSHAYDLRYSLC
jgi:inosine-uridine nucleoside N-ribohydrolase